mmetsp:Transcript_17044/g.47600  ORF Transcript_17044/g.47600 Transcript_17044/m.47600 type:complete len:232 (-) Transcript_17044:664-1359(-)|eukprot:CAMPEP_0117679916 /NCGR_PEP_ID=MMETSP0804-20121206/18062_1 /TAXON_ID=1074897 /ORGANISM="Tetraselmis astigmatica, Strain CCMP880" /LENGTH=231 /DNA_ID=CAMNT_0005489355 /DNA_START=103 /DNA_END=798 /DNA_ORIENTATION=+
MRILSNGGDGGVQAAAAKEPFAALSTESAVAAARGEFPEGEDLFKAFGDVTLLVDGTRSEGVGTIHLTTRRVVWISQADQARGFAVGYRTIMVHAVSRDLENFDQPCIFLQLDSGFEDAGGEDEEEEGGDSEAGEVSELRIVLTDPDQLEAVFEAMSECAALNPDSDMEEDDGQFFYNEDEVMSGVDPDRREAMLDHFDSILQVPQEDELEELIADDPGRFEDADKEEDNS